MPFERTPWLDGIRQVIRLARFGMQTGLATWKLFHSVPRLAIASMFGVRSTGWPVHPRKSARCWSVMNSTKFGRSGMGGLSVAGEQQQDGRAGGGDMNRFCPEHHERRKHQPGRDFPWRKPAAVEARQGRGQQVERQR